MFLDVADPKTSFWGGWGAWLAWGRGGALGHRQAAVPGLHENGDKKCKILVKAENAPFTCKNGPKTKIARFFHRARNYFLSERQFSKKKWSAHRRRILGCAENPGF